MIRKASRAKPELIYRDESDRKMQVHYLDPAVAHLPPPTPPLSLFSSLRPHPHHPLMRRCVVFLPKPRFEYCLFIRKQGTGGVLPDWILLLFLVLPVLPSSRVFPPNRRQSESGLNHDTVTLQAPSTTAESIGIARRTAPRAIYHLSDLERLN